jgi:hypothetical protein
LHAICSTLTTYSLLDGFGMSDRDLCRTSF